MKTILQHSFLSFLAVFVLLLSVGLNFSQMTCDKEGTIYLGAEVPNCTEDEATACELEIEYFSCCEVVKAKNCCPATPDGGCDKNTSLVHFNFETVVANVQEVESCKELVLFAAILNKSFLNVSKHQDIHLKDKIPLVLNKPILSEIQSFLL